MFFCPVHISENVRKEIVPHLVHLNNEDKELIALFDDLYRSFGYEKTSPTQNHHPQFRAQINYFQLISI